MDFEIELVVKIGSMALIDKENEDIDYNVIARVSRALKPGYVLVTSGATEIGRLDYIKRTGTELSGLEEDVKTDYSSQGQAVLMSNYRQFIDSRYSVRQILVEHQHFNDDTKRRHLKELLLRAPKQGAIPIINYNDAVSYEENRKMEIQSLRETKKKVVECIDNDETASQIACLLRPRYLIMMTGTDGILKDFKDKTSVVPEITGSTDEEIIANIEYYQKFCDGASRKGANGARAKLEYIKEPVKNGTTVFITSSKYAISDILNGEVPATKIYMK